MYVLAEYIVTTHFNGSIPFLIGLLCGMLDAGTDAVFYILAVLYL